MTEKKTSFPKQYLLPLAGLVFGVLGLLGNGGGLRPLLICLAVASFVLAAILIPMYAQVTLIERRLRELAAEDPTSVQLAGWLLNRGRIPLGLPSNRYVRKPIGISISSDHVTFRNRRGSFDVTAELFGIRAIDYDVMEQVRNSAPRLKGGIEVDCDRGRVCVPIVRPGTNGRVFASRAEVQAIIDRSAQSKLSH
ncbi:hypothetical protein ACLBWP_10680 [Microbacterium sp. M1A1_1b]